MSEHAFAEIFLHFTWHTKDNAPMLSPKIEALVFDEIRRKCIATDGVIFQEIGGTETHGHLVVAIEPTVLICKFIGQIKGASSYVVNKQCGEYTLDWQPGYGVVSFNKKDLPWVLEYVMNQKQHHATGKITEKLEIITEP